MTLTQDASETTGRGYNVRGWEEANRKGSSSSTRSPTKKKRKDNKKSVKNLAPLSSQTPRISRKTSSRANQSLPDVPLSLPLASISRELEDEWTDGQCMEGLQWCMSKYTSWKNLAARLLQLTQGQDLASGSGPSQEFFTLMNGLLQDVIFAWDPPKASEQNMIRAWKWAEAQDRVFVGAILGVIRLIGLFEMHQVIVHPVTEQWERSRKWLNSAVLARNEEAKI